MCKEKTNQGHLYPFFKTPENNLNRLAYIFQVVTIDHFHHDHLRLKTTVTVNSFEPVQ